MIDTNDFIQYVVPMAFYYGCAVGLLLGILIGIVIEWRLIRKIIKDMDEDA